VTAVLLELAGPDANEVTGLSHQDLANMAGTSRETITRILDEWRLAKLIELERMRIVLLDRTPLRAIADA
jgi:CRP/FNR family cyclic AMP-dependent transcriptional regulator